MSQTTQNQTGCVFCQLPADKKIFQNDLALIRRKELLETDPTIQEKHVIYCISLFLDLKFSRIKRNSPIHDPNKNESRTTPEQNEVPPLCQSAKAERGKKRKLLSVEAKLEGVSCGPPAGLYSKDEV